MASSSQVPPPTATAAVRRTDRDRAPAPWAVVVCSALAYAAVGTLALLLAGPPGYASPLYPSAGIALAVVLRYGRAALPGVMLGAFAVNLGLGALRGQSGLISLALPLLIGAGATLQAGVGAALVRRFVSQPLVLNAPRDILRFGVLGAMVACCVSPSVATPALLATGTLTIDNGLANWGTWWVGDALGVLIGAPLTLTLIGRPRADWQPRRRTLGVPLVLTLALLAAGMLELARLDRQRVLTNFERDVDRLASAAEARLAVPLYALQALHSAARGRMPVDHETLLHASRWWLQQQPAPLMAMGYSERVPLEGLAAFEATARAQGLPNYRVFDRDGGAARAADHEVLAMRLIEPHEGNAAALGVNVWSVPAARAAVAATRASGQPAITAGFGLTQSSGGETGVVIYQALYRADARADARGEPADEAARVAQFRGVVFVTVPTERALTGLASPAQQYLRWCLVDADPTAPRRRLAGPEGCEADATGLGGVGGVGGTTAMTAMTRITRAAAQGTSPAMALTARRRLTLGGRALELRIAAADGLVADRQRETAWLLSMVGLAAASMLGALLLTVTGHSRRTELAVNASTAELRREIAERTLAETALRESEARLRSILDNVPLGVMFLDPRGHLIECNPRLAQMLGVDANALRGTSVAELVHAQEATRLRAMRRELLSGASSTVLEPLRLQGGTGEMLVRVSASALRDRRGQVLRMVGVVEDIGEHLRLLTSESALHRAEEANRAKSEFLSRMSHELRTPLNAMIGFAQLLGLDRNPGLAPQQQEWTQQIQRAGWHLLEMINETLDLARIESGAVQLNVAAVALQPLVAACCAMVAAPAKQRGLRVSESIDSNAGAVLGDATRLKQVLTNLLSNAVKYNRDGGAVTLTARRVLQEGGELIEIAVADTGLGMTTEQQAALFQPYNRLGRENSNIEGTGIGLVISRRLAELMGGTLEASSAAGMGSIFTLRLPAADKADVPVVNYTNTSPAPYQQRLVHYVEDNETNIEVMRGIFAQRAQIRLETTMLGLDGLAAIRKTRPDLVLLDMQLPDISGLELLRHLKQDDNVADIPVVVVSADATTLQTQKALTSGALHYVTKPLDVARFLQIVDAILDSVETRWG